jgi:hypothetical protein
MATRRLTLALVAAVGWLSACASVDRVCEEGEYLPCTCPGGERSQRICLEEGSAYSACIGCPSDMGVFVDPIDEDLAEPVQPDVDGGGTTDLAGVDMKTPPCSATTCTGCCDGNACVEAAAQTTQKCHVGTLTACQACPTGFQCVPDQACASQAPTCDAASCPSGCCDGATCLSPDPSHCGTGGGACNTCARGTLCSAGSCQNNLDPDALFWVEITASEAETTDANGEAWDQLVGTGPPPDQKVCFYDGGGILACTRECPDDFTCDFTTTTGRLARGANDPEYDDALGGSWPFFGHELAAGVAFRVWDMDYIPFQRYETIASGTMFKVTKLKTSYAILPFQRVKSLKFTIRPL